MGRIVCHACGFAGELASGDRIGFRDTCTQCDADLHVCLNCAHHDPAAYNECRESSAERVRDRDRSNRCDYFAVGEPNRATVEQTRQRAQDALAELFKKD